MSSERTERTARTERPDAAHDPGAVGLVDWGRAGRRMRTGALVLAAAVLAGWVLLSLLGNGFEVATLGGLVGLALGVLFVIELVVVGGAALRGMLRAGERGERLASRGVGLLPPRIPAPPRRDEDPEAPDELA